MSQAANVSTEMLLPLVFKLVQSAQSALLRIREFSRLGDVIKDVPFRDGVKVVAEELTPTTEKRRLPDFRSAYTRFDNISR